jgi:hypothetical protein
MITPELGDAYRSTLYVFGAVPVNGEESEDGSVVLKIDTASPALHALHRRHAVDCSCFITARNPFSQRLDEQTNLRRQETLAAELRSRSLVFLPGTGRHPTNGPFATNRASPVNAPSPPSATWPQEAKSTG